MPSLFRAERSSKKIPVFFELKSSNSPSHAMVVPRCMRYALFILGAIHTYRRAFQVSPKGKHGDINAQSGLDERCSGNGAADPNKVWFAAHNLLKHLCHCKHTVAKSDCRTCKKHVQHKIIFGKALHVICNTCTPVPATLTLESAV